MNEAEKRIYTVSVDLGTTNVVVIVGSKNPDGTLYFRTVMSRPVEGMQAGQISNIVAVGNSISAVLMDVEAELGTRISQVYTGISGNFIRCENYTDYVFAQDSQGGISQQDVDALYARMNEVQAPENEIIIERIPQNFKIDGRVVDGQNLVGAFGRQLSATFQFVLCERTPWDRLHMVFDRLGIEVLGTYPTMLTIVESIATPEEREEGVAIVNLGGDKTDLTVIHGNTLRYIASIPIGGAAINEDIRSLSIPKQYVESMKIKYGSAIADMTERKQLPIPGRRPNSASSILDYNLATAIEARMLDIIDCVKEELRESGYGKRLGYGLILAGGGSRLANVADLFRRETGLDVRLAATDQINREKNEPESKPAYATALGIFMRGVEDGRSMIVESVRPRPEVAAQPVATEQTAPTPQPAAQPQTVQSTSARVTEPVQERPSRPAVQPQRPAALPSQPKPASQPMPQSAPQPASEKVPEEPEKIQQTAGVGETGGGYAPVGKLKDFTDDFDDPEKELAGDYDDEPRGKGFFGSLWGRIKGKIEDSFDGDDDVSLGSGDNKW